MRNGIAVDSDLGRLAQRVALSLGAGKTVEITVGLGALSSRRQ